MNWSAGHIEALKNKGLKVKFSDPVSKDRTVEVISNGKKETVKIRKAMEHEESELQQNCVKTFDLMYPRLKLLLFAIPNGGKREGQEAERLVKEGVRRGVLDLFLTIPSTEYHGLYIEMKTATGRPSDYQIAFIKAVKGNYKCVVCRSVEQFLSEINEYLNQ